MWIVIDRGRRSVGSCDRTVSPDDVRSFGRVTLVTRIARVTLVMLAALATIVALFALPPAARASSYIYLSQYFEPDARSSALSYTRGGRGVALQVASLAAGEKHTGQRSDGYSTYLRDRCVTAAAAAQLTPRTAASGSSPRLAVGVAVNRLHTAFGGDYSSGEVGADSWSFDLGALAAVPFAAGGAGYGGGGGALRPELRLALRARNVFNQDATYDGADSGYPIGRSLRVGGVLSAKLDPSVTPAVYTGAALLGDVEWDFTHDEHEAAYFGGVELEFFHVLLLRGGRTSNDPDGRFGWTYGGGIDVPAGRVLRVCVDAASVPPPPIGGPRTLQVEVGLSGSL